MPEKFKGFSRAVKIDALRLIAAVVWTAIFFGIFTKAHNYLVETISSDVKYIVFSVILDLFTLSVHDLVLTRLLHMRSMFAKPLWQLLDKNLSFLK